jgi:hypothetical protein
MNLKLIRFFICFSLGLLCSPIVFSQTVSLECYNNDTIRGSDCAICNKPSDIEVYTGIIVQKIASGDTTRTKIYYPYEIKIRNTGDVLMYDSKSHTSFFTLATTAQFANKTAFITWLKSCHSTSIDTSTIDTLFIAPQVVEVFRKSNDTVFLKISQDTTHFIIVPSLTDHDEQKIDTFYVDGLDSLHLKIENVSKVWSVYIGSSGGGSPGSDRQRFDTLSIVSDIAYYSLQRDSVPAGTLDLHRYLDSIKQFYISNDSLFLRIGTDTKQFVRLSDTQSLYVVGNDSIGITRGNKIKIIENQFLDTATIVSNHLRFSIKDDQVPFSDIDLSAYVAQTLSHAGTINYTLTLSNGGGAATFLGTNGIRILNGSTGTVSIDGLNLQWVAAASSGTAQTIGNTTSPETVTWVGGGINTTTISGNTITITGTEIDGSVTNELQDLFSSSLTVGITNSTSTFQLIAGNNISITSGGTSNNSTFTFAAQDSQSLYIIGTDSIGITRGNKIRVASIDNYADSVTFDPATKILYVGRSGSLSTLSDTINFTDIDTQRVLVYERRNDTLFIRLTNDTTRFLIIKDSFQINTDSQKVVRFDRHGDTLFLKIDNDTLHYVLLPSGFVDTDTDSQSISLVVDSLKISRGNAVSLAKYIDLPQVLASTGTGELLVTLDQSGGSFNLKAGTNTTITRTGTGLNGIATINSSMQYLDTFDIVGNVLRASIFNDLMPLSTVNLATYLDNTDNQYIDSMSIVSNQLRLSLFGDNRIYSYVDLSGYIDPVQTIDTFTLVGNTIRLSLTLDNQPFKSIDLSQYIDLPQTLSTVSLVTSLSQSGGSIQFINGSGITITQGGSALNASYTITATDNSITNELQTLANTGVGEILTTLSNSGGSLNIKAGSNITLSRTGTSLDGIVTINSSYTDNQYVDSLFLVGNKLRISLFNDAQIYKEVDLSLFANNPYQDFTADGNTVYLTNSSSGFTLNEGTNITIVRTGTDANARYTFNVASSTESQYLDTFDIVSNILRASIFNDNQLYKSVNLAPYLDNTDNQVIDTFTLVGNIARLSISGDNQPFKSIDLSQFVDAPQNFNSSGLTIGLSLSSSTVQLIQGNNITITQGGTSANVTYTIASTAASQDTQSLYIPNIDSIGITRGNRVFIDENQYIDTFSLVSNILSASIFGDRQTRKTVDLSGYIDAPQTLSSTGSGEILTTLSLSGGSLNIKAGSNITMVRSGTSLDGIITISSSQVETQYLDTFTIVSNVLRASIFGDNKPFSSVDLSGYVDAAQTLSTLSNTMSLSLSGGSVQYIGSTGISIATGGTALNSSLTFTVTDNSISNEGLIGVADAGASPSTSSQLISNTSTQSPITINVGGIMSISETTSSNGGVINLSALEVQTLSSVNLVTTLTGGTSFQFINSNGISIVQSGTAANALYRLVASDSSDTNEAQTWVNTTVANGFTGTLNQIKTIGGGFVTVRGSTGINITHFNNIVTIQALDSSVTNEQDNLLYSGTSGTINLNISNLQGTGGTDVSFIAGTNVTLTANSTQLTIASADNYADSLLFNTTTRVLTVGRTGALSDLTTTIPYQTLRAYITSDTAGFITQANDTFEISYVAAGGSGGGSITDLSWSGSSSPFTLNSSDGLDVNIAAGTNIGLSLSSGTLTITNTDPDQSTVNEGVLTVTDNTPTTKVINSSGGGSASNSAITLGVSGILGISRSGNLINLSATEAQTLSIAGNVITISGSGSQVTLPSAGTASLTFSGATSTSDSLLSSAGTDVLIKVGGTLTIDSTTSTQLRIVDNRNYYTIPNFSTSQTSPFVAITSSTSSQILAANTSYYIRMFANVQSDATGFAIRLNGVSTWVLNGTVRTPLATAVTGATIQASTVSSFTGSLYITTPQFVFAEYYIKTDANPSTINWSAASQSPGHTITLSDMRVMIEKL